MRLHVIVKFCYASFEFVIQREHEKNLRLKREQLREATLVPLIRLILAAVQSDNETYLMIDMTNEL